MLSLESREGGGKGRVKRGGGGVDYKGGGWEECMLITSPAVAVALAAGEEGGE